MTVEEYVLSMVEGVVLPETQKTLSPEQRAAAFKSWSANHRATPPLSRLWRQFKRYGSINALPAAMLA